MARAAACRRRHPGLRPRGAGGDRPRPRARARPPPARRARSRRRGPGVRGRRSVPRAVPRRPRRPVRDRLPRPDRARRDRGAGPPGRAAGDVLLRVRGRVPGHRPQPGRAAPGARRRRPRPCRRRRSGPVDLRLPWRRRARDPRVPSAVPDQCWGAGAGPRARHDPAVRLATAASVALDRGGDLDARCDPAGDLRRVPQPRGRGVRARTGHDRRPARSTPRGPRSSTSPTCCDAPTSRTASGGARWRCWCAPDAHRSRGCAAR